MTVFYPNDNQIKIRTHKGYMNFSGIASLGKKKVRKIVFSNGSELSASPDHLLVDVNGDLCSIDDIKPGDDVLATSGTVFVKSIEDMGTQEVYDITDVEGDHLYYTNGVLSHNCKFVVAEETLISGMFLATMKSKEPIRRIGDVRVYEEIKANRLYLISLDPALGTGGDRAAIQVFSLPEMEQVMEWCDNKQDPVAQMSIMRSIMMYIMQELSKQTGQRTAPQHSIYWTYENNSVGHSISSIVYDTGEDKFPGILISENKKVKGQFVKGFYTSNIEKVNTCSQLKRLIESQAMKVTAEASIRELKTFVRSGAGFKGKPGTNDDLVMSIVTNLRLMNEVREYDPEHTEKLAQAVEIDEDDSPMPFVVVTGYY